MKIFLFAFLIVFIASCSDVKHGSKKDIIEKVSFVDTVLQKVDSTGMPEVDTTKKLLVYSKRHFFSNGSRKDIFQLTFYGKNLLSGTAVFTIRDHQSKLLYTNIFETKMLLRDMEDLLNHQQKEDTILSKAEKIFDERQFSSPAIKLTENIDDDFPNYTKADKKDWTAIKADPNSIKFTFSVGYESTFGIAYNKRKKVVALIYYSD